MNLLKGGIDMSRQFTRDFFVEVAKGKIPGHSSMIKFGENPDIDSATFEYIWDAGGVYVPPTQARLHNVISTSADDTGTVISSGTATGGSATTIIDSGASFQSQGTPVAAGDAVLNDTNVSIGQVISIDSEIQLTVAMWSSPNSGLVIDPTESGDSYRVVTNASTGASIFHVLGLNSSFLEINEFVVLNGTNNVATANSYVRQYRARVFGPGTTGAVGVITSTAQTDNTVSCQIIDGNNQTLMSIYTVPINQTAYITRWWGSLAKDVAAAAISDIQLRAGTMAAIGYLLQTRAIGNTTADSSFDWVYEIPVPIPGGTDIWIEANSTKSDTSISGGFDILLVDN